MSTAAQLHLMNEEEIPAFVADVMEAGCHVNAVGHNMYVICDDEEQEVVIEELNRICQKYGDRDSIRREIVNYLWSIG